MKKGNLITTLFASILIFSTCKISNASYSINQAEIFHYDCDKAIFQLVNTDVIGDPDWGDFQTGLRYSNAISYDNTCKVTELTNGEKVTLYVSFKRPEINSTISDCYRCQAISQDPPQTEVDFSDI